MLASILNRKEFYTLFKTIFGQKEIPYIYFNYEMRTVLVPYNKLATPDYEISRVNLTIQLLKEIDLSNLTITIASTSLKQVLSKINANFQKYNTG